jgi:alkylhydroperoxidase family enzyme
MIERKQRIPMRDLTGLTGEEADTAAKNRLGGRDLNIFRVMMNHPKLTRRWTVFAGHVLQKQTVPPRERELLILRIGWLNQAEYEWAQHVEIAKRSEQMMDVVFTVGQYNLVSWALNSFGVPLDDFLPGAPRR